MSDPTSDGLFDHPGDVTFKPYDRPSGSLLVVFAAANAGEGKFTFYKNAADAACDQLFIRDPYKNAWYQKGFLRDRGFDASLEALRRFVGRYDHVSMAGSSMGAYAAILFGSLLEADRMLAIGPQTLLNPAYSRSPHRSTPLVHPSIDRMIADADPDRLDIVVGLLDAVDYYNIARLPWPLRVRLHCLPLEDHFLPKALAREQLLNASLAALPERKRLSFPGLATETYRFDDHRADVIRQIVPLIFEKRGYKRARRLMREALAPDPDWALGRYLWAAAAFKLGDADAACRRFSRIALKHPLAVDFNSLAAEAALASGRPDLAVRHARNLLRVRASLKRPREIIAGHAAAIAAEEIALDQAPDEPTD